MRWHIFVTLSALALVGCPASEEGGGHFRGTVSPGAAQGFVDRAEPTAVRGMVIGSAGVTDDPTALAAKGGPGQGATAFPNTAKPGALETSASDFTAAQLDANAVPGNQIEGR